MTIIVVNLDTEEEAAMLADEQLQFAIDLADKLAKPGERWGVMKVRTEVVYEVRGKRDDRKDE